MKLKWELDFWGLGFQQRGVQQRNLASDGLYWGPLMYKGLLSNMGFGSLRHRGLGLELECQGLGVLVRGSCCYCLQYLPAALFSFNSKP